MLNKLVMVQWMFPSMYFIEFTIQDITIGEREFIDPEEDFPPPLSVP